MAQMAKRAREETTPLGSLEVLEQRTTSIRLYDQRVVPGLLQTEAYARAVITAASDLPEARIEAEVHRRLRRQEILRRDAPPPVHAILGEAVLQYLVGDPTVTRDQFLDLAEPRRGVIVQVLPFAVGANPGVYGPLKILRFADEPDVAFADTGHSDSSSMYPPRSSAHGAPLTNLPRWPCRQKRRRR